MCAFFRVRISCVRLLHYSSFMYSCPHPSSQTRNHWYFWVPNVVLGWHAPCHGRHESCQCMPLLYIWGNCSLCLPSSVTGGYIVFLVANKISALICVSLYHLKGLREYIPKSIPSVCLYKDIQTNSGTLFLCFKCLVIYINGFVSTSSTNK